MKKEVVTIVPTSLLAPEVKLDCIVLFNPAVEYVKSVAKAFPDDLVITFNTGPLDKIQNYLGLDEINVLQPIYLGNFTDPTPAAANIVKQIKEIYAKPPPLTRTFAFRP